MIGHGTKFGRKKEEAIAALLTQQTIENAARSIGIGVSTLLRWQKDPEFDAGYRAAQRAAYRQTTARLQQASRPHEVDGGFEHAGIRACSHR
jgi:transposase-like protein